jgi:hypothetical protein
MTPTLKRNEHGLIEGLEYKFDDSGFIDWRGMLSPEHLYPNKDAFNGEEVPESVEGLEDHQILCKLGGYKELARLRGFKKVSYELTHIPGGVSAICTIKWIGNYETSGEEVEFSSAANATVDNTSGFGAKFLETIAENRAFVRAVRNFLNIHIVGADEVDKSKNKVVEITEDKPNPLPKIQNKLRERLKNLGLTKKDEFKSKLKELSESGKFEFSDEWESCDSIPTKEARIILGLLEVENQIQLSP